MLPETPCTPLQSLIRRARNLSPWLFLLAFVPLYYLLRKVAADAVLPELSDADQADAAAQASAQWLDLSGPGSKLLVAAGVFAFGIGFIWLTLSLITPVLAHWARGHYAHDTTNPATDFKDTFLHLPYDQQIKLFCVVWLALLACFTLCWLGAALVQ